MTTLSWPWILILASRGDTVTAKNNLIVRTLKYAMEIDIDILFILTGIHKQSVAGWLSHWLDELLAGWLTCGYIIYKLTLGHWNVTRRRERKKRGRGRGNEGRKGGRRKTGNERRWEGVGQTYSRILNSTISICSSLLWCIKTLRRCRWGVMKLTLT